MWAQTRTTLTVLGVRLNSVMRRNTPGSCSAINHQQLSGAVLAVSREVPGDEGGTEESVGEAVKL